MSYMSKYDLSKGFARLFIVLSVLWVGLYGFNAIDEKTFSVEPPRKIVVIDNSHSKQFHAKNYQEYLCLVEIVNSEFSNALDPSDGYINNRVTLEGVSADKVHSLLKEGRPSHVKCLSAADEKDIKERANRRNDRLTNDAIGVFGFPLFLLVFYFVFRWITRGFTAKSS
jgi:hypothetical protein